MLVASTDERILAWSLLLCIITAGCVAARLIWRQRHPGRIAAAGLVVTLLLSVWIMPSLKQEYIHVSKQALTIETGHWWLPSQKVVDMADIYTIHESDPKGLLPSNLIGDPALDWYLTRTDGRREVVELNDFFSAHRMVVAYYYKDRGYWLERLEDRNRGQTTFSPSLD